MSASAQTFGDVTVEISAEHVAQVEIHRPPNNFFDPALIGSVADAYQFAHDASARAIVLCSEGKNFSAGANFATDDRSSGLGPGENARRLYDDAVRLFEAALPVVAAVQGSAVGGGLGLALSADFRVGSPETKMSANFARLGFHHAFGMSVTVPLVIGHQRALELLYTGRRVPGTQAHEWGLLDRIVAAADLRAAAHDLAGEIAASAPLAVQSIRQTLRGHLADDFRRASIREQGEQEKLWPTDDWAEGVRAMAERRAPRFTGR